MAHKHALLCIISRVQCHGHVTVRTFHCLSAAPAGYKAVISPLVDEQYDLFPLAEPVRYIICKLVAYYGSVAPVEFIPEIYYACLCHDSALNTAVHGPQPVLTRQCTLVALHGRSCGTEYDTRPLKPCTFYGSLPCVIFWRAVTLIAALMLLIYYYKSQLLKWGKQRRPRAYHHIHIALPCALKLIILLPAAEL